ncbi:MAG TPA: trimeric intracellular cation channel family protein [Myxococcaceae bacterium]|nr:trimeric intracellular cation channel family protein [Myxococcaceae bacterium]
MDETVLRVLDFLGTVAFAISGASLGVRRRMDLFGVLVLATVTATAGGITRDILVGEIPPAAIADWKPITVAIASGVFTFYFKPLLRKLRSPVLMFDAAGLAAFAVVGSQKALLHGVPFGSAVLLGIISAIGGGLVRDLMTAQVPTVLRSEIYAVAALTASVIVAGGSVLEFSPRLAVPTALISAFVLRVIAIRREWNLPTSPYAPKDQEPRDLQRP